MHVSTPFTFLNQDLSKAFAAGTCCAEAEAAGLALGFGRPFPRSGACASVFEAERAERAEGRQRGQPTQSDGAEEHAVHGDGAAMQRTCPDGRTRSR